MSEVVVVGGGIAAAELVLALHESATGLVNLTMVAAEPSLHLRPLDVVEPFGHAAPRRLDLPGFLREHGGTFVRGEVRGIDTHRREVVCSDGRAIPFDDVVVALGAVRRPAFEHVLTFGGDPQALGGVLADLEEGYSASVAFVVPHGCGWALPAYELALMTAERLRDMCRDAVEVHLVTPEIRPLQLFGLEASAAVGRLLDDAGVVVHCGAEAFVPRAGVVETGNGADLHVDRIVALPRLEGPRIAGLPCSPDGFVPVDDRGVVPGLEGIHAIGDVTDRPVKQGGLACQQADVTAAHVARRAGAPVRVPQLQQILRGRLLTGRQDRFLEAQSEPAASRVQTTPLWWPPAKISGSHLAPYLAAKGLLDAACARDRPGRGVDVRRPLGWMQPRDDAEVLGLESLGPMGLRVRR